MGAFLAVGSSSISAAPITELGSPEGELNIVAWAGYIERGETTSEAFDWVTSYEKSTGCNVKVKTAGTSDEMVASNESRRF
jgi:putative spermidine/putrescine transport system substrate-binding protein